MARRPNPQPTDGELKILRVLWDAGPTGLGGLHDALQRDRAVAVTTVATMLKTMLAKGLVDREDGPRGYVWSARLSRREAATGLVGKVMSHLFDGSARRLVAHLIEDGGLDDRERAELMDLLAQSKAGPARRESKGGDR